MKFNINDFFAFILILTPLVGTFLFCGKFLKKKFLENKILKSVTHSKATILLRLSPIVILMIITLLLMIFTFFVCFVTYVKTPVWIKIIGFIGIFSFWTAFGSLCLGLHKVVGSGYSSSGKIVKSISDDITEQLDDYVKHPINKNRRRKSI